MVKFTKEFEKRIFNFFLNFYNFLHLIKWTSIIILLLFIILGLFKLALIPIFVYIILTSITRTSKKARME